MFHRSLALTFFILASFVHADEYDTLRLKWRDTIVGAGYNTADPDVASKLVSIANAANNNWASMDKSPTRTFLWSNNASTTISSHITNTYSQLLAMALAYSTPGCSLYGDAALLADIVSGLDWMHANRYGASTAQYDNWWDWEIGSPLRLTDICVLLYDQLTPTQRTNYMTAVNFQTPTPDMTQANKVWKARIVGVRGCLVKNSAKIALCRDAFSSVFPYVTTGDGYYTDGSFIQHDDHPYTAGYGASLISTMAPVLDWLSGSTWTVTDPAQANLFRWVFDSYEPFIYRGNTFDLVRGRQAGRANTTSSGHDMIDSILRIAQFAPAADAERMKRLIKEGALGDTQRDFVSGRPLPTLTLAKQLMNDPAVARRGELLGHYHFAGNGSRHPPRSRFMVSDSRCAPPASPTSNPSMVKNLRGWFTGDGQTTLYNERPRHHLPTTFQCHCGSISPPRRDRGCLAHRNSRIRPPAIGPRAQGPSTLSPHSLGRRRDAWPLWSPGLQFKGVAVTLTGKKTWFMFNDEIVCLGSGITSTDSRPIETTVEQRKISSTGRQCLHREWQRQIHRARLDRNDGRHFPGRISPVMSPAPTSATTSPPLPR